MYLIFLLACEKSKVTEDILRYRNGLESGDCGPVQDPQLRDDCFIGTATKKDLRTEPCRAIQGDVLRGECFFLLAETHKDAALCKKAGSYQSDCALHVLSMNLEQLVPKGATPLSIEQDAKVFETLNTEIEKSGLRKTDPRPWSAIYRWIYGANQPLDRKSCAGITDLSRREACEKTGLAVYNDLLNNARDRKTYPCDKVPAGQPPGSLTSADLPAVLQHTPDPELDKLRLSRQDLCG